MSKIKRNDFYIFVIKILIFRVSVAIKSSRLPTIYTVNCLKNILQSKRRIFKLDGIRLFQYKQPGLSWRMGCISCLSHYAQYTANTLNKLLKIHEIFAAVHDSAYDSTEIAWKFFPR